MDADTRMPDTDPTSADAEWKKIQQNTFTRWCNEHLKCVNKYIYNLETDLVDGLKLIALLQVLSHKKITRYNKKPSFRPQKLENISIALKFIESENIRLVNIDASDIFKGNIKLILGLIWTLILKYQISMPYLDDDDDEGQKMTPKQALLAWVKSKMPESVPMDNFNRDWNDGRAVACLVDAVAPGLFPECEDLDPADRLENARQAMQAAEDWLGVPQVITPEEITNPNVDELSVMTYVSYFPEAKLKPGAPLRPRTHPSAKCSAKGPGVEPKGLVVKKPANFTVFTQGAGVGKWNVSVWGPGKSEEEIIVLNNQDHTYECQYFPQRQGKYDVHVKWNGRHIPKSPFRVEVGQYLDASQAYATGPGLQPEGIQAEENVNLQTELRNCHEQLRLKELLAEQLGKKNQENEIRLREMEQHVTRIEQQLREKEHHQLERSERLSRERERRLTIELQEERVVGQQTMEQLREKDTALQRMASRLAILQRQFGEKDEQEENLHGQLRQMEQELREKDEQRENLQSQLREMEQQLREKDEQEENLQGQLREMEQQLTNLQRRCDDREEETAHLLEQVTTLEGQVRTKEQEVNELERSLSTAQQALGEHQRQQSTPDWVISRDEIQLTDTILGRGGWGSVVKGKYCGCAVAVKKIHDLILSPHNLNLFEREMDIASRCRHPCLLLFIGATRDAGIPLFVTELMESSLRALLEQRPLTEAEVSILSLDVSRGLSYLHQKRPSPIIHRDISSANVLLWRQDDQWRGKLSDYGTANFMQHTMTVAPGAMIYMAPEARTSNQTVKIDVYSFGVLLCEMCIQELPDPERRDQQIAMVTNRQFRALIRRCLQSEPEARPNMEDIFGELEEPDNSA